MWWIWRSWRIVGSHNSIAMVEKKDFIVFSVVRSFAIPNEKFELPSNELFFRPKVTNFGRKTVMSGRKTGWRSEDRFTKYDDRLSKYDDRLSKFGDYPLFCCRIIAGIVAACFLTAYGGIVTAQPGCPRAKGARAKKGGIAFPVPVLPTASTGAVIQVGGFQPLTWFDFRLRMEFWRRTSNAKRSCAPSNFECISAQPYFYYPRLSCNEACTKPFDILDKNLIFYISVRYAGQKSRFCVFCQL